MTAPSGRDPIPRRERGRSDAPDALERLVAHLPGMAYRCRVDEHWTMEFVSEGCRELTGFAPRDLVGNATVAFGELIHPDDRDYVNAAVAAAVQRDGTFRIAYRIRRVDGQVRWVWEQGRPVHDPHTRLEGFITDITEARLLEERARSAEQLSRTLLEQSLTGMFLLQRGTLMYANPRFTSVVGLEPHALDGTASLLDLVRADHRERVRAHLEALTSGASRVERFEFSALRPDGTERELLAQLNTVEVDRSDAILGITLDVTERRRAERQYHQAQKMASLGQLAAGVAHDFNNVLAVIKSSADVLRQDPEVLERVKQDLDEMIEAVNRGVTLGRQLMAFGQVDEGPQDGVEASQVVRQLAQMLDRLTGRHIELHVEVQPDLPPLRVAPSSLEQVVLNLVLNSRDAMPSGGRITIEARVDEQGPPESRRRGRPHVVVSVGDTGTGIDPAVLPHLFEPYFTTKGDRGTGLGLSNVWRIATELGGCVTVDSELGKGSTFSVFLPAPPA